MEKGSAFASVTGNLALSLATTAAGIAAAILAVWLHNHLWRRVENFRSEMLQAEADTIESLKNYPQWRHEHRLIDIKTDWSLLVAEKPSWEVPYDRQRLLLTAMWLIGFYLIFLVLGRI